MDRGDGISALLHIRKLRGGAQSILVRASDGFFYIVKFLDNPQGPNVLFNEAIGTELFRGVGLPVPEWRPIYVSEGFLDQYPECWVEAEGGMRRPTAGWCFGSRFLGLRHEDLYEILPPRRFGHVGNRKDFWTAWVLDVLCGHDDHRQAVFVGRQSGPLEAYFIDHGYLFFGASGNESPRIGKSRYLDPDIYAHAGPEDADNIQSAIQGLELNALTEVADSLPEGWRNEGAALRLERFKQRISDPVLVTNVISFILGIAGYVEAKNGRSPGIPELRVRCADLHNQILPARGDDPAHGRGRDVVGDQRRRGHQVLHPPLSCGANP